VISASMQDLFERVYSDTNVTPSEIVELREAADEAAANVLDEVGREGNLDALCKSFDVTSQLVQLTVLGLKNGKYTELGNAMVMSLIEAHISLLRATQKAFE
jgi:hypothetical protein